MNIQKPKKLIYSLIYPGVLFAGIFTVGLHVPRPTFLHTLLHDSATQLGILFLVFFCASYLNGHELPVQQRKGGQGYNFWTLTLDVIEVILMFTGFYALRLLETGTTQGEKPAIEAAYVCLILVIIEQLFWRMAARIKTDNATAWVIRVVVLVILLSGALLWTKSDLVNPVVVILTSFLIAVYLIWFRKE